MSALDRPLSEVADRDAVDNVLLFVSDSTRLDALPERVAERGVTAEAVAPSSWTASSLPSLTSGRYPTSHGVWGFDTRLPRTPRLLREAENAGFDAPTIWTHVDSAEKPPLWVNRVEEETPLSDLDAPFVHVVHDKGGHSPYGFSFSEWESSKHFFEAYADRGEDIPECYARGVARSADRFLALVEQLESRGLLENTLAMFTSDHGELLGEPSRGGVYGHGAPMTPELVRVPVTFVGAGLPEGAEYDRLLSGVDLAPTAVSARGGDSAGGSTDSGRDSPATDSEFDGIDVWRDTPPADRTVRSEIRSQYRFETVDRSTLLYAAASVWDDEGGVVAHRGSTAVRAAYSLAGHLAFEGSASVTRSELTPRLPLALLRTHVPRRVEYGTVSERLRAASEILPDESAFETPGDGAREDDSEDEAQEVEGQLDKEQLRKLGYVE